MHSRIIYIVLLSMLFCGSVHAGGEPVTRLNYSWNSSRMDEAYWGVARGDVDGDGAAEDVLLARGAVKVGKLGDKGFVEKSNCTWSADAAAARIFLADIDGDGISEIIVSGVSLGKPISMIMKFKKDGCSMLADNIHWSMRKIFPDGAIAGQWWNSDDYFSGPVYRMSVSEGGVGEKDRIDLPWHTGLFQFVILPGGEDGVLIQKGYAHIEQRKRIKSRFKRLWRSPEKMGGTANAVPAESRRILADVSDEYALFDVPPIVLDGGGVTRIVAVKHDMPVHGIVGKKPYIRSAEIVVFREDPALGFVEEARSVNLPGAVVDWFVDDGGKGGAPRLYVLLLEGSGFFMDDSSSVIFSFDVPAN